MMRYYPNFPYSVNLRGEWSRRIMVAWAFGQVSNYTLLADHFCRDTSTGRYNIEARIRSWQQFFLVQEQTKANIQAWALEQIAD